ncbi:unnamed protein product [Eruca vesicaria subsp. sativa]|uniref:non-specific serine/threonine protein kinase n=1 Tax=Eruca vesicaria subsp. sativa TaxID=29727 RepID=A0ABC8L7K1_ERUVS|nr:unnamed protein product [Eruca vesicaria subsp. sativa]
MGFILRPINTQHASVAGPDDDQRLAAVDSPSLCYMWAVSQGERGEFGFNGYLYDSYGTANLDSNGLLKLTNYTVQKTGQVFYNFPVRFKDSPNGTVSSFSTTFVFAIVSQIPILSGHGIAFAICPTKGLPYSTSAQYLGLFNITSNGDPSNHVVAVEFDTIRSSEFNDMDDNHVGIDINSLRSEKAASAGYYKEDGTFEDIKLISRKPIQAWVEYDSSRKQLNITLHPLHVTKPKTPLLSLTKDLSPYLLDSMYVGFTSSTGSVLSSHYILGWTFMLNGKASDIDPSRLPKVPDDYQQDSRSSFRKILAISLSMTGLAVLFFLTISFMLFLKRKKLMEVLEDWEVQFGPHRFAYKDLYIATKGFKNSEILGKGGFGKVYKVVDERVKHDDKYLEEQVTMVLKLGLLCSHPVAAMRPSMSSVIQFLDGVAQLPHNLLDIVKAREIVGEATESLAQPSSIATVTFTESFASHGR